MWGALTRHFYCEGGPKRESLLCWGIITVCHTNRVTLNVGHKEALLLFRGQNWAILLSGALRGHYYLFAVYFMEAISV